MQDAIEHLKRAAETCEHNPQDAWPPRPDYEAQVEIPPDSGITP